jgi:dipeptidyl aminopeptidase/acylaminoacyl peptidase
VTSLVLVVVAGGPVLLAGDELFTPRHVTQLKRVMGAEISPDGAHIAYGLVVQRRPLKDEDGPAWVELHVVDREGNNRPFITGEVNIGGIQWTPDGKEIAYTARRGEDKQTSLYGIPIGGGESQKLCAHESDLTGVAFCRADDRIAFLAAKPLEKERKEYREKGFDQQIYEEDWRPETVWITRRGSQDKPRALQLDGSASYVEWSPDGRKLVVVLAPTPLVDDGYMFRRVYVVDGDTGRVIERVNNPGKLGAVRWSPDGKHLAMISGSDIHDPMEGRLMVAQVPGDGSLRDLLPNLDAHMTTFAWRDADTIIWLAAERQSAIVGTVDLNGASQVLIKPAAGPVFSYLSLNGTGAAAALVGHSPTHPEEVFLLSLGEGQAKRLTDSNPWLNEMKFGQQSVFKWKARDGLDLEGVLVYPLNHEPGRRYPLIMTVHGGPEAHVSNGWVTSYASAGQVGAARGFAVLYPNYRGSTGRGVAFSKMGQADAAGKEFDDLVDAIDALVAQGLVDKDKVGITGGSYGGYAAAWGATYYSDRYAASVMFVGISDNVSKVGTTDIPQEMFYVHHRKRLWDDWDYFLNRSPIRHIQKNHTPTLILHGKNDPRVHPSQSLELFRHLKTLGQAPVRLVLYQGEGHGNRKAAAQFDYNLRLLRWMEHYLHGPGGDPPDFELDYTKELGADR